MSKLNVDALETVSGEGKITLKNQLKGMTAESMPSGSVIQVIEGGQSAELNQSSGGTWVDTGTSVVITPTASDSKVLISACILFRLIASSGYMRGGLRLLRDSTIVWNTNSITEILQVRNANNEWNDMAKILKLDSPATTSAVTYKVQSHLHTGDTFRIYPTGNGTSMILQEIKG